MRLKMLHCGIVAIVGRPNTGKSTLLNAILGEKLAIVSKIPQTTRYKIRGILTDQRGQAIFIDTPGLYLTKHRLGTLMMRQINEAIDDSDVIIHLVDTNKPPGQEERRVIEKIKKTKAKVILGLNKIDLKPIFLDTYIKLWEEAKNKKADQMADDFILMPLSALSGTNIDKLREVIFSKLPESELLYPQDIVSDFPQRLALADIIREKLFNLMRNEIPHSLAVYVDETTPRKEKLVYIHAMILIERASQKAIIIGKDGRVLKEVGKVARQEIEQLLGKKVFLEMQVKVKPNWRQDPQMLKELGYT